MRERESARGNEREGERIRKKKTHGVQADVVVSHQLLPEHLLPFPLGPSLATHFFVALSISYPSIQLVGVSASLHSFALIEHAKHSPADVEKNPLEQREHC